MVAEFAVFDDFLGVRGEAVAVVFGVGEELLLAGAGFEVAERGRRRGGGGRTFARGSVPAFVGAAV